MVVAVNSMSMIKNGKVATRQWPTILVFRKNRDSLGNGLLIKLDSICFYTGGSGEMLTSKACLIWKQWLFIKNRGPCLLLPITH